MSLRTAEDEMPKLGQRMLWTSRRVKGSDHNLAFVWVVSVDGPTYLHQAHVLDSDGRRHCVKLCRLYWPDSVREWMNSEGNLPPPTLMDRDQFYGSSHV